eukprot:GEMP01032836.1.p1 GENE.GEMP01032836.1~~GEMP01032836.1.p1  ORF type:complete len:328 (+),score=64.37 GEMP01032836.1:23-985(+)
MSYGLVLISHGSPLPAWNADQMQLREKVEELVADKDVFKSVKWAWLEFAKPDIADTCYELEKEGVARIIAVPIFISTSSHSSRDIPNALGTMFHPVQDENCAHRYRGLVPVTYLPCMDHGSVLIDIVSDSAKTISEGHGDDDSAVIVLSHGDGCEHFWNHMHERIRLAILEKTGITDCTHAFIQTLRKPMVQKRFVDSVRAAEARGRSKIFVISCFNGTGGAKFIERAQQRYLGVEPLCVKPETQVIGDEPWTMDPRLADFIANSALNAGLCMLDRPVGKIEADDQYPPYNPPFYLTLDKGKDPEPEVQSKNSKGKGKSS